MNKLTLDVELSVRNRAAIDVSVSIISATVYGSLGSTTPIATVSESSLPYKLQAHSTGQFLVRGHVHFGGTFQSALETLRVLQMPTMSVDGELLLSVLGLDFNA